MTAIVEIHRYTDAGPANVFINEAAYEVEMGYFVEGRMPDSNIL